MRPILYFLFFDVDHFQDEDFILEVDHNVFAEVVPYFPWKMSLRLPTHGPVDLIKDLLLLNGEFHLI